MYIATIPNRNSPPAILLREGYREGGKVKNRTLANLSKLPPEAIEAIRRVLKGEQLVSTDELFEIVEDGSPELPQVDKMRESFGIGKFVLVGDRGMITQKQVDVLREIEDVDWLSAMRPGAIRKLVEDSTIEMSLFDERNLFELEHPDWPGERLIACRNQDLAVRREAKRKALIEATTAELDGCDLRPGHRPKWIRGRKRETLLAAGRQPRRAETDSSVGRVIHHTRSDLVVADGTLRQINMTYDDRPPPCHWVNTRHDYWNDLPHWDPNDFDALRFPAFGSPSACSGRLKALVPGTLGTLSDGGYTAVCDKWGD